MRGLVHRLRGHAIAKVAMALIVIGCREEPTPGPSPEARVESRRDQGAMPKARSAVHDTVVVASWGSGLGELGHTRPAEAVSEGPMAMAIDSSGRIHVLDQVNGRIVIFEAGKATQSIALPHGAYQDIALDARGRVAVLDRLRTASVALLDDSGAVAHTIPIVGKGLVEGGASTALFAFDDGVWIESEHQQLVRVGDMSGNFDRTRPSLAGRPSLDGRTLVRAALAGPASVAVSGFAIDGGEWLAQLDFELPITSIRALESDAAGRIYLAAYLVREQTVAPFAVAEERQVVVVLSPTGAELSRVDIVAPKTPEEQFRPIRVGSDGSIYQLVCHDEGVTIERFVP